MESLVHLPCPPLSSRRGLKHRHIPRISITSALLIALTHGHFQIVKWSYWIKTA